MPKRSALAATLLVLLIATACAPTVGRFESPPVEESPRAAMSAVPAPTAGTTYYVRPDGGTADQCTGLVDAPYPGSGTGRPCAWAHPFWALDGAWQWRLQGGDTLIISGDHMLGYGAPNAVEDYCSVDYPWGCHLPPLPSGPNPQNPTRLLGAGWDAGCPHPPQLWGTERAEWLIDLTGTSNAMVACLELTDHSGCAMDHCDAGVVCKRDNYPYGEYADYGILATDADHIVLRDLNIHGLGNGGILAARITDWTVENVRLGSNGQVGWNGDVGEDSSNGGTLTFRRLTVEWNGCPETYPGQQPAHCWAQELCGGYGDGFGVARSDGHWVFEDSLFRYNTSDGLDLLYVGVDHPDALVELHRCIAYGNAGNQFKIGGRSRLVNSLAVGNCAYFYGRPFAGDMGPLDSGNHCRAGGAAISINLPQGRDAYIVNCTIAGAGWALAELQCNDLDFPDQPPCNGTERVYLQNSVFRGYQVVYLDYPRLADFIGDGDPYGFTTAATVDYNVIYDAEISSPTGTHDLLQDPLFVGDDIAAPDAHLRAGSPALDNGLPVGELGGLVPADDLDGLPRPAGGGVDRGAYERREPTAWAYLPLVMWAGPQ